MSIADEIVEGLEQFADSLRTADQIREAVRSSETHCNLCGAELRRREVDGCEVIYDCDRHGSEIATAGGTTGRQDDVPDTDPPPGEHDPDAVEQLAAVLHEADRRAWVEFGAAASGAGVGWPWEDLEESHREPVRFRARCILDQFDLIAKG